MKQPHEDITGAAGRAGDPLVSLSDDHLPVRVALTMMARHLQTATLVGDPAPVVARMAKRLRAPQVGDLVIEQAAAGMHRDTWWRGFGYLAEHRLEWCHTDAEWEKLKREDGALTDDDRWTEDAWYIQYGPATADVCRWVNCSFRVIPITDEAFTAPAGERDGTRTTFTRDSLLGSLADSGFAFRLERLIAREIGILGEPDFS
jgi:hypothetical protein